MKALVLDTAAVFGNKTLQKGFQAAPHGGDWHSPDLVAIGWRIVERPLDVDHADDTEVRFTKHAIPDSVPSKAVQQHLKRRRAIAEATTFMGSESLAKEAIAKTDLLDELIVVVEQADVLVAHNIEYDLRVLQVESERVGNTRLPALLATKPTYCTALHGRGLGRYNKRPRSRGYWLKIPKLVDLYEALFGTTVRKDDIYSDIDYCAHCYFALRHRSAFGLSDYRRYVRRMERRYVLRHGNVVFYALGGARPLLHSHQSTNE